MEENINLSLWEKVERTNPKYTKAAKKGQHHFTSITPVSQFRAATEVFGIQGIGWGVKIGSEVFSEREHGETVLLSYDAILFFKYDMQDGEIPIHATEKACYKTQGTSGYLKVDEEARKKVVTNAKTKGLSELGFNADIFMGMYDDQEYVSHLRDVYQLEEAEDKDAVIAEQEETYHNWADDQRRLLSTAASVNELRKLFKMAAKKANSYKDHTLVLQLTTIKDKRKAELDAQQGKES